MAEEQPSNISFTDNGRVYYDEKLRDRLRPVRRAAKEVLVKAVKDGFTPQEIYILSGLIYEEAFEATLVVRIANTSFGPKQLSAVEEPVQTEGGP